MYARACMRVCMEIGIRTHDHDQDQDHDRNTHRRTTTSTPEEHGKSLYIGIFADNEKSIKKLNKIWKYEKRL